MSLASAIDALRAKLDVMFSKVQATRQIRDELDIECHILHKGFDAYIKADVEYQTARNTYWKGIEELRALIDARDAEEAEAARATNSQQSIQSN
jgi:hypothetical protein